MAKLKITTDMLANDIACIAIHGDEMSEVYVNNSFAQVLFWSPQCIDIKPF